MVDSYDDVGLGPQQPQATQEEADPYSECTSCGCCCEAFPQYAKIEFTQRDSETEQDFQQRKRAAYAKGFIGVHTISQPMLFNAHPNGKMQAGERLDALMAEGGIQMCGNAQNCVVVCPKEIPLTTSIAETGRATTLHLLKK